LRRDLLDPLRYQRDRDALRKEAIELRRARNVRVGDRIAIVFEHRRSLLFQLQEALLAAGSGDEETREREIAIHEGLLPGPGVLAGTLYLEIGEPSRIREDIEALSSLEQGDHLRIEIAEAPAVRAVLASFPHGDGRMPAARWVRFEFPPDAEKGFRDSGRAAFLVLDHPISRARIALSGQLREQLKRDLAEAAGRAAPGAGEKASERRSVEGNR
jgi:hypothetical protein